MSVWSDFVGWVEGIGHSILDFLNPLAASIAKNGGDLLVSLAQEEVAKAEDAAVAAAAAGNAQTGLDKFAAAQKGVVAELVAKGIPVVLNAVNGAIEAAVAKSKAASASPAAS